MLRRLVERAEAKFVRRTFGTAPFTRASIRERQIEEDLPLHDEIATGILGGVTDQNLPPRNIFVWMHFFLASRPNIRILHNANSRQTRQKEREGRCMEDATIN